MASLQSALKNLSELSQENIELFCSAAEPIKIRKNEFLLTEGNTCKNIWFIEAGFFRSFYLHDGHEINTAFHFEGSFVTNVKSLRMEKPAEYSIVAGENAFVYRFSRQDMLKLYAQSKEIVEFGKKLIEMLFITEQEYGNLFRLFSAQERYEYILKNNPFILQRIPLGQLASYLGMSRETLSRMRKK